jgi:type VI secretion system protein ImpH
MAATKRQSDTSVATRLFEEYYGFSFFKAVELLESLSPEKKKLGQALVPDEEAVRFSVKADLVFPASEISALARGAEGEPAAMEVAFLGLTGPSGVLPYWYTELIQERLREKDSGLKDFLDLFHHRLLSLFYLAWKKHKFCSNYLPGAKDRLSGYLLSLTGLGTSGLAERIGIPVDSLAFYSGHLSRTIPSALSIESAVSHFSGVPAKVEQFIERVLSLEPEDQTAIGLANSELGETAVVGSQIRECRTRFRVVLGPLSYAELIHFLPSGDILRPIFYLVKYMVGIEYEFEIRLILKAEEVPRCVIGTRISDASRLGWTTWLKAEPTFDKENPWVTFQETDLE